MHCDVKLYMYFQSCCFFRSNLIRPKYLKIFVIVERKDSVSFIYPLKQWGQNVSYCKEHRMMKPGSEITVLKADASNDLHFLFLFS